MIVSKLKAIACVALVSLSVGLMAYGQTQGNRSGPAKPAARPAPPAADELQTLRLELEALRGNVEALRGEVAVLRRRVTQLEGTAPTSPLTGGPAGAGGVPAAPGTLPGFAASAQGATPPPPNPNAPLVPGTNPFATPPAPRPTTSNNYPPPAPVTGQPGDERAAILDRVEKDLGDLLRRVPNNPQLQGELQKAIQALRREQSRTPGPNNTAAK